MIEKVRSTHINCKYSRQDRYATPYTAQLGALFVAATMLITACNPGSNTGTTPTLPAPTATPGYVVSQYANQSIISHDEPNHRPGCSPLEVAQVVMRLFEAFNRGDQEQLAGMFSLTGHPGQMFVAGEVDEMEPKKMLEGETYFFTRHLRDLLPYFAERHQHEERLRLVEINVGGDRSSGTTGIVFLLTRQADDLTPGLYGPKRFAAGRGVMYCKTQSFYIWSIVTFTRDFLLSSDSDWYKNCPTPPPGFPKEAVIACRLGYGFVHGAEWEE